MSGSATLHAQADMFDHASSLVKIEKLLPGRIADLKILDVGCGDGRLSSHLVQLGAKVTGLDIHPKALAQAKRNGLKTILVDLETTWPINHSTFDLVLMLDVLEHVVDIEHCLSEAKRVLRPGGQLIIAFPNHFDLRNRLHILFGGGIIHWSHVQYEMEDWNYGHVRFLRYTQWLNLLKKMGLQIEAEQFNFMGGGILPARLLPNFLKTWLMKVSPDLFSGKFVARLKVESRSDLAKTSAPPQKIYLGRTKLGM
jgi:methionine biosynthesis protein MetW